MFRPILILITTGLLAGCTGGLCPFQSPSCGFEGAFLTVQNPAALDFGDLLVNNSAQATVTIVNQGNTTATAFQSATLPSPFAYAGNFFPGTGGSCGASLAPGSTCQLNLAFNPSNYGAKNGVLRLAYHNGFVSQTLDRDLNGRGVGTTATLDLTFNGSGMLLYSYGDLQAATTTAAIQPDGKIVTAGYTGADAVNRKILVARLNVDGTFDTTFGTNGTTLVPNVIAPGNADDEPSAIELQPDGKIVITGVAYPGTYNIFFTRLNADGSLDTTFGPGGSRMVSNFPGSSYERPFGLALQPDGKMVAVGWSYPGSVYNFALTRYDSLGAIDTTFGGTGKVLAFYPGGGTDQGYDVVVQADGKIVAVGYADTGLAGFGFSVIRFLANGTADSAYGPNGNGWINFQYPGGGDSNAYSVVEQPDGKLVMAGEYGGAGVHQFAIMRMNTDGSLDTTFGGTDPGWTKFNFTGSTNDVAQSVALQADGKIVVLGTSYPNAATARFATARLNADGTIDTSFGTNGKLLTDFPGYSLAYGGNVTVQSTGEIICTGFTAVGIPNDPRRFAMIRFWP